MEEVSVSSEERDDVQHIVTIVQMLKFGLELFFTIARIDRVKNNATNVDRFTKKFGVKPVTACMIYEDMQTTTIEGARINNADEKTLKLFLISLHFLRKYSKESDMESTFNYSPRYISRLTWDYVYKIQAFKAHKIVWPNNLNENDI